MFDYRVIPVFWGKTFPRLPVFPGVADDPLHPTIPYTPSELCVALDSIARTSYFSGLRQYNAKSISVAPPSVFSDPWPNAGNGFYVANFTQAQVVAFLESHLDGIEVPSGAIPIYAVVIPSGSLLDGAALGAHFTLDAAHQKRIWFWMYGSNSIKDACHIATHEIVESIGADFGVPNELCDDCVAKFPDGRTMESGLTVETYFDARTKRCVAPGSSWIPQTPGIGGGTSHSPALATYRDRLFAAWKGEGGDERMFWSSFDGSNWAQQTQGIGGATSHAPALAVYRDRLFAAWKGEGNDERMFWSSFDGSNWTQQTPGIGGGTSHSPALATYQDRLFAAWRGGGGDERMFWSNFDGSNWTQQTLGIGGGTSSGPSLATYHDRLFAAWKGGGNDERMFWSSFDGVNWAQQQQGIGGGTSAGPALASFDGEIAAAWKGIGTDQRMFWSNFGGSSWDQQQVGIGGGTSDRVALAVFQDQLFAAWKGEGSDQRMFWSSRS
jgi:hypothetical protein